MHVGNAVAFVGSSDYGTVYAWTFGDGTTGAGSEVLKTYTTTGTFTIGLAVTGNNCTKSIMMSGSPAASLRGPAEGHGPPEVRGVGRSRG